LDGEEVRDETDREPKYGEWRVHEEGNFRDDDEDRHGPEEGGKQDLILRFEIAEPQPI
jgi:hypothetical protein